MSRFADRTSPFPKVVLLGALALGLAMPATEVAARVGLTSAAEGDPLGKAPAEAERILRIGVDIQSDELVTTGATDRAHLVFLDGTALTVGPNAQIVIDKFVYDPATATGDLSVTIGRGVVRIVGGKISKTRPIAINAPTGYIGIRGGITIVDVQSGQTTSTFMFGRDMTVTGQGQTQVVTRPGFSVTTLSGAPPARPTMISEAALAGQIRTLEGRSGNGNRGTAPATGAAAVTITQGTQGLATQPQQNAPAGSSVSQVSAQQSGNWQQWGGGVAYQNPVALNAASTTLTPGQTPSYQQLPMTGTATYNGSFSATTNGTAFGGSISLGWNFASQSGTLTAVANGQGGQTGTATSNVTLVPNTASFSGPLSVRGQSGSGTLSGNFVTTSNSAVGAVRGTFSGTSGSGNFGSSYSGSFSGTK